MNDMETLKALIFESVAKLYANDSYLINRGGMELACKIRVAIYMQEILLNNPMFRQWRQYDLDCEYNKSTSTSGLKEIPCARKYIQTDLVLHIRGTNQFNLLACEFKLTAADIFIPKHGKPSDAAKLQDLTDERLDYKYRLGCAIALEKQGAVYKFFQNAQITD